MASLGYSSQQMTRMPKKYRRIFAAWLQDCVLCELDVCELDFWERIIMSHSAQTGLFLDSLKCLAHWFQERYYIR